MSRYCERDDYEGEVEQILAMGRWENNARRALKSERGRKALAEIRDALLALPDKRLIASAMCTVGGPARIPEVTDAEIAEYHAKLEAAGIGIGDSEAKRIAYRAEWMRDDRRDERDRVAYLVERSGEGVCVNGALLWHRKVKAGMDPGEAFAALPAVTGEGGAYDPLDETASLAAKEAGVAYTLAWELAYRNDETYGRMTPEDRYTAFLAWIDAQLAESVAA